MTAVLNAPPSEPTVLPRPAAQPRGLGVATAACLASILVAADAQLPLLRAVAGLFLLIALPTYLVFIKRRAVQGNPYEGLVYSFVSVLLGVLVGGLVMNETLPLIGIARPLDRVPVLVAADLGLLGLAWWSHGQWPQQGVVRRWSTSLRTTLAGRNRLVVTAGLLLVLGAVVGAIRLNNGAGGTTTAVMLCSAAAVIVALIKWRFQLRPGTIVTTIYLLSLALLLMTSLRGWDLTGHDIQREFHVFQLTATNGIWDISRFRDAYDACLSITILPTILARMTGMSGTYVFKVLFQLVFALCPVIVYLIARRFGSVLVAVLAAVYFASFPTFFTDMPFLCRQEIAFVFVGAVILVATNERYTVRRRQMWVAVLSVGVVLSHYSTTYVLIGLLVITWATRRVTRGGERFFAGQRERPTAGRQRPAPVFGIANIAVLILLTAIWTGPVTQTGGQLEQTTTRLLSAIFGGADAAQSSDVSYSLFSALFSAKPSASSRMQSYAADTLAQTAAARAAGAYYPLSTVNQYPTPLVEEQSLPLTAMGRALDQSGIDVPLLNAIMRKGAAGLLQIFVCLGIGAVALRRAHGFRINREFFYLAVASVLVVASQVVLPAISADYGLLRAFQQSLFVLAPFLAVGSIYAVSWLGSRRSMLVASGIAVGFFASLTGVIPQALGGYPAQLHLNNTGQYYDLYYLHPEELAAMTWLQGQVVPSGKGSIQTAIPTDRYTFDLTRAYPQIQLDEAIYPTLLRPDTYVLLGSTIVTKGQSTVFYDGDLLTYRYPVALLDRTKDLIYSSGRAAIYR
jgi:uncharacterized membrane protein